MSRNPYPYDGLGNPGPPRGLLIALGVLVVSAVGWFLWTRTAEASVPEGADLVARWKHIGGKFNRAAAQAACPTTSARRVEPADAKAAYRTARDWAMAGSLMPAPAEVVAAIALLEGHVLLGTWTVRCKGLANRIPVV